MPLTERIKRLEKLSPKEQEALKYVWEFWARPDQRPPAGNWQTWLILSGRGYGKTRTGAEETRARVESGKYGRLALIGETAADVRDVMVEGTSGIMAISPPWNRPNYEPSKRRLTWPNGAVATTYSAEEPDQLRGPEHDWWWGDEIAKWKYAQEAMDNLMFGLRVGANPCGVGTTTPRPVQIIRAMLKDPTVHVTKGSTYDNRDNLPATFLDKIIRKYEGTRLGRQELNAELLEDVEGALWTYAVIEKHRVKEAPDLQRIVVAIDPAVTSTDESDETGIGSAGVGMCNCKGKPELHGFVLNDLSGRYSPDTWARRAVNEYHARQADRIVAEKNQGGDMVEHTIRTVDRQVPVKLVSATRGKYTRAEPVAALYEQGKVHHVGTHPQLEDQLTNWVPGDRSPDRLDWLVWAMSDLMVKRQAVGYTL